MHDLAMAYRNANRHEESLALLEKVYEIDLRTSGRENLLTLAVMGSLGSTYCHQGHLDKGIPLLEKCLELTSEIYGPDHVQALSTMGVLSNAYARAKRPKDAIAMAEKRWDGAQEDLGLGAECGKRDWHVFRGRLQNLDKCVCDA